MVCHGPDPPEHPAHEHELPAPALPMGSDSEDDADERYDGYMPLAGAEPARHSPDDDDPDAEDDTVNNGHHTETPPAEVPHIEPMESILVREVWNAPRTTEPMDNEQAQQVMQAMAGFSLPASAVPAWARGLPDEALRDRLRALTDR